MTRGGHGARSSFSLELTGNVPKVPKVPGCVRLAAAAAALAFPTPAMAGTSATRISLPGPRRSHTIDRRRTAPAEETDMKGSALLTRLRGGRWIGTVVVVCLTAGPVPITVLTRLTSTLNRDLSTDGKWGAVDR